MSLAGKRYALALLEVAKQQGNLKEVYEQFKLIIDNINEEEKLWELLNTPSLPKQEKKKIISNLYENKLSSSLLNFLNILLDKKRMSDLKFIFASFKDMYYTENNMLEANVVSAIELSDEENKQLKNIFEKKYNKTIILENEVDESIIGGLIVYIGDYVIDGSIKKKINNLKNNLKEIRLQELGVS